MKALLKYKSGTVTRHEAAALFKHTKLPEVGFVTAKQKHESVYYI